MKPIRWRATVVTFLALLAAYAVAPTVIYFMQPVEVRNDDEAFLEQVPSWLPQSHVKLGLDLQGGVQLVLGVQTDDAIKSRLERAGVEVARWAKDEDLGVKTAYVSKSGDSLVVQLKENTDPGSFNETFRKQFPRLVKKSRNELVLNYGYSDKERQQIRKSALERAEQVVRTRVDRWGVSEPMINRRADGNILVQLPGFSDSDRAKELLGRTAKLKFNIVDDEFTGFDSLQGKTHPDGIEEINNGGQLAFRGEDREALVNYLEGLVPEGRSLFFQRDQLGDGSVARYRWTSFVVRAASEVTGDDIQDASVAQGSQLDPTPFVSLTLNALGGRRFADVTGANVGKRLAIVLDGIIESAPQISERIGGGQARIGLGGAGRSFAQIMEDGQELALILKSGAIPAKIEVLEQRQVGASLGPELANRGIKGVLIGLLLVLLFMLVYYMRPGFIACLALVLNALFLLAVMAGLGAALTLPGIAGFILTLGMAVDANVLINERIRQELKEGRHPRKAVDIAFKKVFWTIFDANITTLIAAVVLLETNSSGPIRGFAVTIILGLLVSMFTSLYCTRLFFDVALSRVADNKVKLWLGVKERVRKALTVNYLSVSGFATAGAIALAVAVILTAATRGLNFGVDFAGGTELTVEFSKDIDPSELREVAQETKISGLSLQALEGKRSLYLVRYDEGKEEVEEEKASASDTFLAFKQNLVDKLASYSPDILQVGFVGPQVGKELRTQGALSVLFAILAILIYIALRFDMRFAPGAMIKMLLDVFIMLGFYVFFWTSFDLVAVAAFLTVVGYSVNDTIVIYDRIRENIGLNPRRSLKENINLALNETLTRSINTSMTTILSLGGILVFGTGQIWNFAMAMAIGVGVAALSSIFVASNFVIWMDRWLKARRERLSANAARQKATARS